MNLWRRARRPWLLPLVPLYASAVAWRNRRFDDSPARSRALRSPVVSVGSISAGGAGKTPFLIALARLLSANGTAVDVLSRGYGRHSREVLRVDATGTAARFGDEPLLIARSCGCPVYVGADRFAAGTLAEETAAAAGEAGARVHLLDDAFQHRQLRRGVDIVLLTQEDVQDLLLPAGNLREGLDSLLRAGIVAIREDEREPLREFLLQHFGRLPHLWTYRRTTTIPNNVTAPAFLFSGIARPHEFAASLRLCAPYLTVAGEHHFDDHQNYGPSQIALLLRSARAADAQSFITTQKDAVKLTPALREQLESLAPLHVADLRVDLTEPARVLHDLRLLLALAPGVAAAQHEPSSNFEAQPR